MPSKSWISGLQRPRVDSSRHAATGSVISTYSDYGHRVFQHSVDEDDIDAGELDVAFDPLLCHLALVDDELKRQLVQL